jgi:hypothetical protein
MLGRVALKLLLATVLVPLTRHTATALFVFCNRISSWPESSL